MTPEAFRASLSEPAPPPGLSLALQALWWDARGDWDRAHDCAQEGEDAASSAVHAYLHRREGDLGNASVLVSASRPPRCAGRSRG